MRLVPCDLRIYYRDECIRITAEGEERRYSFDDIVGATTSSSEASQNFLLQLHTFAKEQPARGCCGCRSSEVKRVPKVTSLASISRDLATTWRRKLLWAIEGKPYNEESDPERRKVLVLINPFGGAGAAAAAWNVAHPFLESANVLLTVKHTERAMHAHDIVHEDL